MYSKKAETTGLHARDVASPCIYTQLNERHDEEEQDFMPGML